MKFLRNLVDKKRALYHAPDSKFHKIWPLFDAMETFLFAPGVRTPGKGPHVRDYIDVKRMMTMVIYAMVPCLLFSIYNTGYQHFLALAGMGDGSQAYVVGWLQSLLMGSDYAPVISAPTTWDICLFGIQQMGPIIFVSYFVGLNIEGLFAVIRKEEVSEGYLVTGMLVALVVPASIPLWQLTVAVAFSVVLAKEIFGGTGMNIFNPALMVRAFLFFGFAGQISGSKVWVAGNGAQGLIDGYSGATPLAAAANARLTQANLDPAGTVESAQNAVVDVQGNALSWWDLFWGWCPGSAGETSAFCCLLGAALLVFTGIASWRVMAGGVIGLVLTALLMNSQYGHLDGLHSLPPHFHLVMGGFAFGIVFMATDPVSSPETQTGKWIYGLMIGFLTVVVRAVNPAYPEGAMLAILLLNAFAPAIDHFVLASNIRRRKSRHG
jgi:Na+-transporting NADH:ubiquinone oxidoreductase subunit B